MGQWYRTDRKDGYRVPLGEERVIKELTGTYPKPEQAIEAAKILKRPLETKTAFYEYSEDRS